MKKWITLSVIFSVLVIFSYQYLYAEDGSVLGKLDKIMESQTQILKDLSEIKAELQIVKVRATNR